MPATLATLALVFGAISCGDDTAVTRYQVTYSFTGGRSEAVQLTATVDYATARRRVVTPSSPLAVCEPRIGASLQALDNGRGRLTVQYYAPTDDTGGTDSNPLLAARAALAGPAALFDCTFEVVGVAPFAFFDATITDALDAEGNAVVRPEIQTRVVPLGPPPPPFPDNFVDYDITLAVDNDAGPLGALQFDVSYLGDDGGWRRRDGSPRCSWNPQIELHACNDRTSRTLRCAAVEINGFDTPTDVVTCVLAASEEPMPDSFAVSLVEASSPEFSPASVDMRVGHIAETDPGVSQATPSYDVTAEVIDDVGRVGALQFEIEHTGTSGGWQGAGGGVRCSWHLEAALSSCNDIGGGRVRCAIVDIAGFDTPAPTVTCTFKTDETLSPSNFVVNVVDASSPEFGPLGLEMEVTRVERR